MNWKQYLPATLGTTAVIATLIACTASIEKHLDALAPENNSFQLAQIDNRLRAMQEYTCSMDRTLQSIDTHMLPPTVNHHLYVQPCPGDPGRSAP
jgi:hypothetical protein